MVHDLRKQIPILFLGEIAQILAEVSWGSEDSLPSLFSPSSITVRTNLTHPGNAVAFLNQTGAPFVMQTP